jgi:hypothetical protein
VGLPSPVVLLVDDVEGERMRMVRVPVKALQELEGRLVLFLVLREWAQFVRLVVLV